MLKQMILAHPWLSDQGTITASGGLVQTMPVSNLLTSMYPTDRWRSTALTVTLQVNLPQVEWLAWNLVAPLYTNAGPDATMTIQASVTKFGATTYDSGPLSMWPSSGVDRPGEPEWHHAPPLWLGDAARTEPWVKIIVDDPDPIMPEGYAGAPFLQWGRLYVALGWQPSYHHDRGAELTPADERSRRVRVQGGGERVGGAPRPRRFKFNVSFLDREEMLSKGWELDRIVGTSRDLLVIDDPSDTANLHKGIICGTLPEAGGIRHDDFESWSKSYVLQEIL